MFVIITKNDIITSDADQMDGGVVRTSIISIEQIRFVCTRRTHASRHF